ncbi:MAG: hypothetical protein E6538_08610 [Paeniclostridium sordellii]|nr:hypothetical protein [Paeniclostridium sordellii]
MKFKRHNSFSRLISNDHSFFKLNSLELLCCEDTNNSIIGKLFKYNNGNITIHHICNEDIIINNFIKYDNMTYDESQEYYEFNIEGAHLGPTSPVFISISRINSRIY